MTKGNYPKDALGNVLGPDKWDSDNIPSMEEVRRSHSPEFNKRYDDRLAKARVGRLMRKIVGRAGKL